MAEQTVSILAVIKDAFSIPADKLKSKLGEIGEAFGHLKDKYTNPLKEMREGIEQVRKSVEHLKKAIEPLTGGASEFLTGFFSFELIKKSLEEATKAKKAEAALLVALKGDEERFESISKIIDGMLEKTALSDDALYKVAASLSSHGVSFTALPDAMQRTADIAAGLTISSEEAATVIEQIYQGRIPRALARTMPGLQAIKDQANFTAEAFKMLDQRFAGAAERYANTDIGKIERAQNELNNAYEKLGFIFLKMEAEILPKLVAIFRQFLDSLSSPRMQTFLQWVTDIASSMIVVIPWILKFYTVLTLVKTALFALKIGEAVFGLLTSSIGLLLNPMGLLVVGLILVLKYSDKLPASFGAAGRAAKNMQKTFMDVFKMLEDGSLTPNDIWASVIVQLKVIGEWFKLYFWEIPKSIINNFIDYVSDIFGAFAYKLKGWGLLIGLGLEEAIGASLKKLGEVIDLFTSKIAAAVDYLDHDMAESLKTHFGAVDPLAGSIAEMKKSVAENDKLVDEFNKKRKTIDFGKSISDAQDASAARVSAIESGYKIEGTPDTPEKRKAEVEKKEAEKTEIRKKSLEEEAVLQEEYTKIIEHKTDDLRTEDIKVELAEVQNAYAERTITVREYLEKKHALEQEDLNRQFTQESEVINKLMEEKVSSEKKFGYADSQVLEQINQHEAKRQQYQIQLNLLKVQETRETIELERTENERTKSLTEELQVRMAKATGVLGDAGTAQILELQKNQFKEIEDLRKKGSSALELENVKLAQQAELVRKIRDVTLDLAQTRLQAAQKDLKATFQQTNLDVSENGMPPQMAEEQQFAALQRYRQSSDAALATMRQELAEIKDPALFDQLQQRINEAQAIQTKALTESKTLVEKTSASMAQSLQGPMDAFIVGIIKGKQSARQLFGELLQTIGDQILNFMVSSIVTSFLKFLGGGTGGGIFGGISQALVGAGVVGGAHNRGGIVGGPANSPDRDSVLAYLTPREGVITRSAVAHYGEGFIHAANRLALPRAITAGITAAPTGPRTSAFNSGGIVKPSSQLAFTQIHEAVVAPTEDNFRRMIQGGKRALWDVLASHQSEARSALGIQS